MTKRIIPPQKELEQELRDHGRGEDADRCPRCGTAGQRFLRRCPGCRRRYRSARARRSSLRRMPGRW